MICETLKTRAIKTCTYCLVGLWIGLWANSTDGQQKYFVELEIISSSRGGIDQNQRWIEALADVGADSVRMSQTRLSTGIPSVEKIEGSYGATYKIVGVLSSRDQLVLPGGRFSIRDKQGIRELIQKIRDDGAEVALAEKLAFGLTAQQLVDLHADLSRPYPTATRGASPKKVLEDIKRSIKTPILIETGVRGSLNSDHKLHDELKGLSSGTALAAALRPLGLVAAPRRLQGKKTEIVIADSRNQEEHWPVGWPLETRRDKAVPKLFDRIPANIRNFQLDKALGAIQSNLKIPFLFDHNSLARQGIELDKIRVSLQSEKLAYQLILQRLVSQARPRINMELRADEAGTPFMWFSARAR